MLSPITVVNVVGCLLIGVASARVDRRSLVWAFAVTGALGGFTTFSAFSVELRQLLADGDTIGAGVFVVFNVVGGLVAFASGRSLAGPSTASDAAVDRSPESQP